ncbi:MAG: hypothetical protein J0H29_06565 [Sphingobacteriales bacterium]|nr:hypothetical protein [Sphingobacteriales bacterium]OJY90121.1 MAG: hypothetical protein BGP14_10475 [Sphingobacteriales bacterium 44-15]
MKRTSSLLLLILLLSVFFFCKKDNTGGGGDVTSPLIKSSGWETVHTIKFSDVNTLQGGFRAEDPVIDGNNAGMLYGEVYNVFKSLTAGDAGKYKTTFTLSNKTAADISQAFEKKQCCSIAMSTIIFCASLLRSETINVRISHLSPASLQAGRSAVSRLT